jgi:para-nitrobenzyl esterase
MEEKIIVETKSGKVRGYSNRGVIKFKGIPYVEPPIDNLRFKPPVPIEPWDNVRDATKYSPIVPQISTPIDRIRGSFPQSEEDSLTLNIFTKSTNDEKRPVMFFIHGGAFSFGGARNFDGSHFVLRGNVVFVSINYRVGPFGFLFIPEGPNATANVGLLDTIAGLKWVQDNISVFGGDPENITVFGVSAGAYLIACLFAMPSSKGLFKRAILESGSPHKFNLQPSTGIEVYETLMKKLGLENGDIESLRKLPYESIIKGLDDFGLVQRLGAQRFVPTIDKNYMPQHPLEAVKNGATQDIDLFIGTNLDETKMWSAFAPEAPLGEEGLHKKVIRIMQIINQNETKSKEIIEIYRKSRKNPKDIFDAINTDYRFRIPSIRLAEEHSKYQKNTYMYLFTWQNPIGGGKYGANHGLEGLFVFDMFPEKNRGIFPGKTEETLELSEKMIDAWIAFVRSGNPNHENIPELPPYDKKNRATILFDKEVTIEKDPYKNEREAWKGIL